MGKTVVITAGGTIEQIDMVRHITNMSSGKLGAEICKEVLRQQDIKKLFYICPQHAIRPPVHPCIEFVWIKSVEDLKNAVTTILLENKVDYFIHAAAVSDYAVDYVTNTSLLAEHIACQTESGTPISDILQNKPESLQSNGKISSSEGDLVIKLKPTPKIISLIKELQPHTFLVGFKLLNDVPEEELFDTGFALLRKNRCNLVLANDLALIRQGKHTGMLIYPEKRHDLFSGKEAIATGLVQTMLIRGEVRHPKSICESNDASISTEDVMQFRYIGQQLNALGCLPEVEKGTYGNLSVREEEGLLITGRNIDKGNITKNDLARVYSVLPGEGAVYAHVRYAGAVKPSIDSGIHGFIYQNTDWNAIVHVHTDKIFPGFPITDYNYPCGTDKEMDSILRVIKENPNTPVLQMHKHGLLAMGNSLSDCYFQLENLLRSEISIRPTHKETDAEALSEWLEHFQDVGGEKHPWDPKSCYAILYGEEPVGVLYITRDSALTFVMYTLKQHQRSGFGIGGKVLSILTEMARAHGIKYLKVLTTEKCGVKDYYTQKHGFIPALEQDDLIALTKTIRARA